MILWHQTCDHGRAGIGRSGWIYPGKVMPWLSRGLVWMSSDPDAPREANGLTSIILACDRTQYVYAVERHQAIRWLDSPDRTPAAIAALEGPEQDPALWWVSAIPVRGRLVRVRGLYPTNATARAQETP